MRDTDLPAFAESWNDTLELKGQRPVSDRAVAMAFEILSVYSLEQIERALGKFLTNPDEGQYHLQPSAIVKMIEGDSKTAANKAWQQAWKIATSCGDSGDIVIRDQITMLCIEEMGGLQRLCNHESEFDLKDFGRSFRVLYEHYRVNGFDKAPTMLKGTNNAERERFGLPAIAPRMIGFEQAHNSSARLPDMSKPRYEQIEKASPTSAEQARENLKQLMSYVGVSVDE